MELFIYNLSSFNNIIKILFSLFGDFVVLCIDSKINCDVEMLAQ